MGRLDVVSSQLEKEEILNNDGRSIDSTKEVDHSVHTVTNCDIL